MKTLTLAITTYNRPHALINVVKQVADSQYLRENFKVLIVNDSGNKTSQKEYDKLVQSYEQVLNIVIYHNSWNIGLAKAFTKLVEYVDTEYFLYSADDDLLVEEKFKDMINFLNEKKPSLLVPRWLYKNGKIGRGINNTRKVKIEEFRLSSGHLPGIFFKTEHMLEFADLILKEVDLNNSAAITYPGVFYHIPIILKYNNSWWYDAVSVSEGLALPSNLKDSSGLKYSDSASRFQQIAGFDSFINKFENSTEKDLLQAESRAWSISKAVRGDKLTREKLLVLLNPSLSSRIKRRLKKIFLKE